MKDFLKFLLAVAVVLGLYHRYQQYKLLHPPIDLDDPIFKPVPPPPPYDTGQQPLVFHPDDPFDPYNRRFQ